MNPGSNTSPPDPSLRRALLINRVCDEFEAEWKAGRRPVLAAFALRVGSDVRDALLLELVPIDVEYRQRRGERPVAGDYAAPFPQLDPAWLARLTREPQRPRPLPAALGEYDLGERIATGGMGEVYLARHRRMNRAVAMKIVPPTAADRSVLLRRFAREVEITAKLSHPNVVTAFDAGEHAGIHYLVTEYVSGGDLGRRVKRDGPLPVAVAIGYARQAACGLAHAHARGVIHRDVKPSNLLVDHDRTVRVADWGLARTSEAGPAGDVVQQISNLTPPETVLGTVDYLPPEQASCPGRADARSDVYSLGCVLFFLLTGHPPFVTGTALERILAHRDAPPPGLGERRADAPPALASLIARMLAKLPGDRPGGMDEVAAALDALTAPVAEDAWSEIGTETPLARKPTRRRALFTGAALASGLLCAGIVLGARHRGKRIVNPGPVREERVGVAEMPVPDPADYQRRWALQLGLSVEVTDPRAGTLVFVPPGTFTMGSTAGVIDRYARPVVEPNPLRREWVRSEQAQRVTVPRPFYFGRTEVTHAQFARFVTDTGHVTAAEQHGGGFLYLGPRDGWRPDNAGTWRFVGEHRPTDNHPVLNTCVLDAEAFCRWLSASAPPGTTYRLPTEAEWEFACRAGGDGIWGHGDDERELVKYAVFGNQKGAPRPVASLRPNAFGLFDMHGNHAEWCAGTGANLRPARGGKFVNVAGQVRSAVREWLPPHSVEAGFRVLREIAE